MSTREAVQKWLHEGKPTSVPELAKQLGRHPQSIYKLLQKIQGKDKSQDDGGTEALLEACRSGTISDESANKILGRIIADGKDADRIKAIDIHDTRNRASSSRIGPPPPQTPQQTIDRLSLLMQAAEPAQLMEAAKSCGYQMVPSQPAQTPPDPAPVPGPLNPVDLTPPEQ